MFRRKVAVSCIMICFALAACSGSEEPDGQSKIKETQEKIAAEAVESIKTPIDQAKLARQLTEQHNQTVEGKIENQQ